MIRDCIVARGPPVPVSKPQCYYHFRFGSVLRVCILCLFEIGVVFDFIGKAFRADFLFHYVTLPLNLS